MVVLMATKTCSLALCTTNNNIIVSLSLLLFSVVINYFLPQYLQTLRKAVLSEKNEKGTSGKSFLSPNNDDSTICDDDDYDGSQEKPNHYTFFYLPLNSENLNISKHQLFATLFFCFLVFTVVVKVGVRPV